MYTPYVEYVPYGRMPVSPYNPSVMKPRFFDTDGLESLLK